MTKEELIERLQRVHGLKMGKDVQAAARIEDLEKALVIMEDTSRPRDKAPSK